MANWMQPTVEELTGWTEWVASRPALVRDLLIKHSITPWKLYRLKSSGHRVTVYSVEEHMDDSPPTLKVTVSGQFNAVAFERQVFGIKPEDLEECDLPPANMPVGSLDLTPEQVRSILPFPLLCKTPTKGEVN